jgi:hypothetical protein
VKLHWFVSITIGLVTIGAPALHAQVGGVYDLSWNTIDSGGSTSVTGGAYAVGGTIGQVDAGLHTGGAYILSGGFWAAVFDAATDVPQGDGLADAPRVLALHPASPNPFGRETTLAFDLPHTTHASARIYSASGQLVRTLIDGAYPAGRHQVMWPGTNDAGERVAQGVYVARLEAGAEVATRKLVLTR